MEKCTLSLPELERVGVADFSDLTHTDVSSQSAFLPQFPDDTSSLRYHHHQQQPHGLLVDPYHYQGEDPQDLLNHLRSCVSISSSSASGGINAHYSQPASTTSAATNQYHSTNFSSHGLPTSVFENTHLAPTVVLNNGRFMPTDVGDGSPPHIDTQSGLFGDANDELTHALATTPMDETTPTPSHPSSPSAHRSSPSPNAQQHQQRRLGVRRNGAQARALGGKRNSLAPPVIITDDTMPPRTGRSSPPPQRARLLTPQQQQQTVGSTANGINGQSHHNGFNTVLSDGMRSQQDSSRLQVPTSFVSMSPASSPSSLASFASSDNEDDEDEWPEHVLLMSTKELNRYLKTRGNLTEEQAASLKRARRRLKNRMYAKRSRDKRSLSDVQNGHMCVAQMRAKITRLQTECDRLRQSRDQLMDIVRARCPDALSGLKLLSS